MRQNVCKIPLNACGIDASDVERAQNSDNGAGQIWKYVVARLSAMRVDACTTQVKQCLTSDDRCGADFSKCIGLDLDLIRNMCPTDKLVGCQKNGALNSFDDIDNLILGIYLDIDNSLLQQCQNAAQQQMIAVCGDVSECIAFETDTNIGTESLLSYENANGDIVIEGLVAFSKLQIERKESNTADNTSVATDTLGDYEINVKAYTDNLDSSEAAIALRVTDGLESMVNKINQKIAVLSQDPTIQMCITGRNIRQITRTSKDSNGNTRNKTEARFPHLLDSYALKIMESGINQAKKNYNNKYNSLLAEAMEKRDDTVRAAACAAIGNGGTPTCTEYRTDIAGNPICISYEATPYSESVQAGNTQTEASSDGQYAVRQIIAGVKSSSIIDYASNSSQTFVQTDNSGNMLGTVKIASMYSAADNTCIVTTTTTMCKDLEKVVTTDVQCDYGGFDVLGGRGCTGSGGVLTIGGGSKITKENYHGTYCKDFMEPIVTTNSIKM